MPPKTCPGKSLFCQFLISILTLVKKIRSQINFIVFLLIVCLLPIFLPKYICVFFANCMLIFLARSICVILLITCLFIWLGICLCIFALIDAHFFVYIYLCLFTNCMPIACFLPKSICVFFDNCMLIFLTFLSPRIIGILLPKLF